MPEGASVFLDFARGAAALLVMAGHLRSLFFVQYGSVLRPNPLIQAFYFFTSLGHQAVMVFFVLSGFFISGNVMRALSEGRWRWSVYLNQRLVRLWLVLLPGLVLGAAWDQLGMKLFGTQGIYGGAAPYILNFPVADHSTLDLFISNALFLQGIWTTTFGSNGALWSLSNEFWYYMLFPCCLFAITVNQLRIRAFYCLLVLGIALFVGPGILWYFPIWLLGLVIRYAPRQTAMPIGLGYILVGLSGIALLGAFEASRVISSPLLTDIGVGIASSLLFYSVLQISRGRIKQKTASSVMSLAGKGAHAFAAFSYTLYIVHLPFLVFLRAFLEKTIGVNWQPTLVYMIFATMIGIIVLGYAWLIARYTEARTTAVRSVVARTFNSIAARLAWDA